MIEVRQSDVFRTWMKSIKDQRPRARVLARINRLALGNPGDVKAVGSGVSEIRID